MQRVAQPVDPCRQVEPARAGYDNIDPNDYEKQSFRLVNRIVVGRGISFFLSCKPHGIVRGGH